MVHFQMPKKLNVNYNLNGIRLSCDGTMDCFVLVRIVTADGMAPKCAMASAATILTPAKTSISGTSVTRNGKREVHFYSIVLS